MAGRTAILSVRVVGDAKSGVDALNNTERSASRLSGIGKAIGTGFKVGAGVVAAGAVATLGKAIQGGFQRLSGIENAQAKMKGLGHDTKAVDLIMQNALNSVEGTAYGLDEAATVAASAVAAGITPGKELDGVLGTIANSAAAAGGSMGDMGSIFTKVASTGKAQNDSLNQIADRGIPIYQSLADQLGVTTDEVFKMASAGDISFSQFEQAMSSATGSVAAELGNTATGSMANFNAALSRLGAGLLAGVFPQIAPLIQAATGVIDRISEAAGPASEALGGMLGGAVEKLAGWLNGLQFDSIEGFLASAGPGFVQIGDAVTAAAPGFQTFAAELPAIGSAITDLASGGIGFLGDALGFLATHMDTLIPLIPVAVAGFVAWSAASSALAQSQLAVRAAEAAAAPLLLANQILRFANVRAEQQLALAKGQATAATVANTAAERGGMLARAGSVAGMVAQRAAMIASTVATKAATIAQRALNLAMRMNPIGLVIAALALLVGGIIWAWNNVDWFRNGIIAAWDWIKTASQATWSWIKNMLGAVWQGIVFYFKNLNPVGFIITHWSTIKSASQAAWQWVKSTVSRLWDGLVGLFKRVHPVGIIISNWDKIKTASRAAWEWVKRTVSNLVTGLNTAIRSRVTQIVTGMRNSWNNAKSQARAAFMAIVSTVTGQIGRVISTVRSLPGRIRSALGNLGSLLVGAGRSLIQGFTRGIRNAFSSAVNAVKNGVKRVRNFFPFSPAKEGPFAGSGYTTHSGKALIVDFANAMTAQAKLVRAAASTVASAALIAPPEPRLPRVPVAEFTAMPARSQAGRSSAPSVVIERGAIEVRGLVTNPDQVGRELVDVLDQYFTRRGMSWR